MTGTPFCRASALALLSMTITAAAGDWPQYRGPEGDGITREELDPGAWGASGPRQVWRTPTPNGFSSFAIANGRAYTIVARNVEGAPRETLVAMDASTGLEAWARPMSVIAYGHDGGNAGVEGNDGGDGPRSTPSVAGDRVYAFDSKFVIACFEAASGRQIWRRDLTSEHDGPGLNWGNAASPLVDGARVYVAGGGRGQALLALDRRTGEVVWKTQDDKPTHATPVLAKLHGVEQVIFFTQKGLVAVRPESGEVLWRQAFRYSVSTAASPVVEGDIVYCSAGYGVGAGAFRIERGEDGFQPVEIWRSTKLQNHWSTPVVRDGHLYGMFGFKEYGTCPLQCVELATGEVKWSKSGFGPGNVIWADDHLLALGDAGQLAVVECVPDEYREKARWDILDGKCWSTPAVAGGRLYARSTKEGACFDLSTRVAAR